MDGGTRAPGAPDAQGADDWRNNNKAASAHAQKLDLRSPWVSGTGHTRVASREDDVSNAALQPRVPGALHVASSFYVLRWGSCQIYLTTPILQTAKAHCGSLHTATASGQPLHASGNGQTSMNSATAASTRSRRGALGVPSLRGSQSNTSEKAA